MLTSLRPYTCVMGSHVNLGSFGVTSVERLFSLQNPIIRPCNIKYDHKIHTCWLAWDHWPQYMDSWLARFCILVNACHRKYLGSHFTPVKTFDRHTDFYTYQCMKCNRWKVLASNFMKILRKKKMKKFHRSSRLLNIYWKLLKNLLM